MARSRGRLRVDTTPEHGHCRRRQTSGVTAGCIGVVSAATRLWTRGNEVKVRTSDKVLSVLRLFTVERSEWTVEAVAGELGLPQSTAYDYVRSLVESELIAAVAVGRYVLGPAVVELDRIARKTDPILVEGGDVLEQMVRESPVDVVALLCRLYRMKVMCVDQRASAGANFAISYERGRLMPLFRGAASKVLLANLERRRLKRLFEDSAKDIDANGLGTNWDEFRSSLRQIKSTNVHITRGELDAGRVGLSIALLTPAGDGFASISYVAAENDFNGSTDVQAELQARLLDASASLTRRLCRT